MISDLVNRAQGEGAKKKEAKRKRDLVSGNINSYSRILNNGKNLEKFQDCTELLVGLEILNAEKDKKLKEILAKKAQEAANNVWKKGEKEAEEVSKWNEFLPRFREELQKAVSTTFSIFWMLACFNTSVIISRRGLLIYQKQRRLN